MKTPISSICVLVATLSFGEQTNAGVVIDITETGGNVQATLSGDFRP